MPTCRGRIQHKAMQSQKPESGLQPISVRRSRIMMVRHLRKEIGRLLGIGGMMGAAAILGEIAPAWAGSLTNWHYDPAASRLEITVKDGTKPRYFLIAQPARIVVDLPDTSVGTVDGLKTYAGAVRSVRVSQFQPGLTRIVLELSPNVALAPGQVKLEKTDGKTGDARWVIRPLIADRATSPPLAKKPVPPSASVLPPSALLPIRPVRSLPQPLPAKVDSSRPLPPPASNPGPPPEPTAGQPTPPPSGPPPSGAAIAPQLDAGMVVDTAGAIPIAVPQPDPAPVVTPAVAPTVTSPVAPPVKPLVTLPIKPPATPSAAPAVKPVTEIVVSPAGTADTSALPEIPSTLAVALPPSATPTITVPPLSNIDSVAPAGSSPFPPAQGNAPDTPPESIAPAISVPRQPGIISVPPLAPLPSAQPGSSINAPVVDSAAPLLSPTPPSVGISPSYPASGYPASGYPASVSVPPLVPPGSAAINTPSVPRIPSSSVLVQPNSVPSLVPPGSAAINTPSAPRIPSSSVLVQPSADVIRPMPSAGQSRVVDFGQPLPTVPVSPATQSELPASSSNSAIGYRPFPLDVLLPTGSLLSLRYPGETPLKLDAGNPQQEVLLLQTDIRDSSGNVVAPEGTPIIGRFETSAAGSRFVAQAIALQGRNIPFPAQSDLLDGNRRITDNNLVRNTGIGLLAGGLIGGLAGSAGAGVVGGAAAGAAATFLTAPKPATIQPGQVIQIRTIQDLKQF